MDESRAWIGQALSDRDAGDREWQAVTRRGLTARCHAVAKYQQAVEKAVKALVTALREAGFTNVRVTRAHEVTPYMSLLVRPRRSGGPNVIQRQLSSLLDPNTRARIRSLESLAPRWPGAGRPGRNTEYPFLDAGGEWTCPAEETAFAPEEVESFRALAGRVTQGAERIISAIRRAPK